MNSLLQFLAYKGADILSREFRSALWPVVPYLRSLGTGISLILLSAGAWLLSVFFLLLGLFFFFAQIDQLLAPALWTSLLSFLFASLIMVLGLNLIRRPRY